MPPQIHDRFVQIINPVAERQQVFQVYIFIITEVLVESADGALQNARESLLRSVEEITVGKNGFRAGIRLEVFHPFPYASGKEHVVGCEFAKIFSSRELQPEVKRFHKPFVFFGDKTELLAVPSYVISDLFFG